jgi:RimJ/RimL family protein N-acetyltransferase
LKVLETDRLILRRLSVADAAFILDLVNDPDWLRFIGDKGVRTLDDARNYIQNGPLDMYDRHGFGLWCVELKSDGSPIGICGLIKRETLEDVDVGFAFLPAFRGCGYATESAAAAIAHGRDKFGLKRIVAITSPDNDRSARVLEKAGLRFEKTLRPSEESADVCLFAADL